MANSASANAVRVAEVLMAAFTLMGQHQTPFEISSH